MKDQEEFLAHYGVRGMKWGVRRALRKAGRKVAETRPSDEGRAAGKILDKQRKYGTSALTNHELRVVNARIKLEQEFQKNFPPPKTKLDKGLAFAKKFASDVDTIGSAVKAADKAQKIARGKFLMSDAAKQAAKLAAVQKAVNS